MKKHSWVLVVVLLLSTVFVSACGSAPATTTTAAAANTDPDTVTLAYQPSLGSTLLVIIRHQKTLEKQFPHTHIQWKVLNSGAAVREAVIANQADFGYLGVPPFLVGWANGLNWKVLSAVTASDAWLVARDAKFKTLKDFGPNDKIGVVAPDSLQAIILRKAAQKQLGDAHALDHNLVSIAPADAEQALLSGQIAANFASAPFQFREVAQGGHVLVHSYDVFGHVSSDEIAVPESFYNKYPVFAQKLHQDLVDAVTFEKTNTRSEE